MNRVWHIYCITCKVNGKRYIGQTFRTPPQRWVQHIKASRRITSRHWHFYKAIRRHGIESFEIETLSLAHTQLEADNLEKLYIRKFNTLDKRYGYNLCLGVVGRNGSRSVETRKKLGVAHGGKTLSDEHRRKISQSLMGHVVSEETRRKIARPCPEEVRKKISQSLKGTSPSLENRRRVSERFKGKPLSLEHRKKISESRKGIVFSSDHRRHISEALTGRLLSAEHKRKVSESVLNYFRRLRTEQASTD